MDAQFDMDDFVRIVVSENQIRRRLDEMAAEIRADYEGQDLLLVGDSDVDLDQVNKELDMAKRRGQKVGDPAWRRLERLLEDKRTAELTSDFEDYDIGVDDDDEELSED